MTPADETIINTSTGNATIIDDEIKGQSIEEKTKHTRVEDDDELGMQRHCGMSVPVWHQRQEEQRDSTEEKKVQPKLPVPHMLMYNSHIKVW